MPKKDQVAISQRRYYSERNVRTFCKTDDYLLRRQRTCVYCTACKCLVELGIHFHRNVFILSEQESEKPALKIFGANGGTHRIVLIFLSFLLYVRRSVFRFRFNVSGFVLSSCFQSSSIQCPIFPNKKNYSVFFHSGLKQLNGGIFHQTDEFYDRSADLCAPGIGDFIFGMAAV